MFVLRICNEILVVVKLSSSPAFLAIGLGKQGAFTQTTTGGGSLILRSCSFPSSLLLQFLFWRSYKHRLIHALKSHSAILSFQCTALLNIPNFCHLLFFIFNPLAMANSFMCRVVYLDLLWLLPPEHANINQIQKSTFEQNVLWLNQYSWLVMGTEK